MIGEASDFMIDIYKRRSKEISAGNIIKLYLQYCIKCKTYRHLSTNAPCGPGGTLSCPLCRELKQHGPGIESSFGRIRVETLTFKLPEDLEYTLGVQEKKKDE